MSHDDAQAFVQRFLEPLLLGGVAHVGLPMARETLDALRDDLTTSRDLFARVDLALQRQARALLPAPPPVPFTVDDLLLVVGLHQLVATTHAEAERERLSPARLDDLVADTLRLIDPVADPADRAAHLSRHLLTRPLLRLYRRDTHVRFRWGALAFYGEHPEWTRWPWRRRVRDERVEGLDLARALLAGRAAIALRALLRRAPLTRLLHADRLPELAAFDPPTLDLLRDEPLCRCAVQSLVEDGLGRHMPGLARAFKVALEDPHISAADRRYAARFLVSLALTDDLWHHARGPQRLLDVRCPPPTSAVRVVDVPTAAVDGDDPQPLAQRSWSEHREALNRDGWALVALLLERDDDPLGLPDVDRDLVARFTEGTLQRLAPNLRARRDAMQRLLDRALPRA